MAKKKTRKKSNSSFSDSEVNLYIYSLLMIVLSIIGVLEAGPVGEFLTNVVKMLVGNMYGIFYLILIVLSILLVKDKTLKGIRMRYYIGFLLLFIAWLMFCAIPQDETLSGMRVFNDYTSHLQTILAGKMAVGGGLLGAFLYGLSSLLFDRIGSFVVIAFLVILGVILLISKERMQKISAFFGSKNEFFANKLADHKQARAEKKRIKNVEKETKKAHTESKPFAFIDYESFEQEDFADMLDEEEKKHGKSTFIDVSDVIGEEENVLSSPTASSADVRKETPSFTNHKQVDKESKASKYVNDFKNYRLPNIRLLNLPDRKTKSGVNVSAANESGKQLVYILEQFGVNVSLVDTHIGPSVTKFELRPENGVRVNRISNLQQDIKMGLAAKDIRIEAPIPGKSTVGIEIPNQEKTTVAMRDLMKAIPAGSEHKKLLFALGKDLMGNCVYGELNKMPHLLIAGATGSGKSVCVNAIITSILMRTKPDEVKMLLIDPKKVEFTQYAKIPHLIAPVITNGEEASRALKVIVKMMEDRYDLFSKLGVRNIAGYNHYLKEHPEEVLQAMPFIMVVIDELADLMLVAAKEVESSIQRITQLARAAGIHLIVATQRPSVDVITGVIKANIPSRIAFAVSSAVDSRTILDQQGAEKLLGLGDMLYVPVGEQVATRVQGCFVSDNEVTAIAQYCSAQALPRYDDIFLRLEEVDSQGGAVSDFDDPLYEEVRSFVIEAQKASTSFIQRKFSIGYSRAARLIDSLEANGVVGPSKGSKPREVFIKNDNEEEN
ncbi:MAG: DNA translocase FtsK [Erysipelotrichia bacterium]|nr:DNA translocase FtsK [Erysipelotrichia bacterium]